MKIRQIKFSNINNLKGAHEINFDRAPLKNAGIFAITGPTGSGKSTILDVITLALFNKIPRFKASISKGKIQELGSILTHHTSEASASIEYEIKGQVYVSAWSVSKARTGNLKDYEMTLMDSSGSYMDLKRSEVPARNEEIIGLKYEQFVKSIILSQGQFSRFLKADKNERGQLLENLTGTSIYRKIGIQAYQKFKTVSDRAKLEKEKLEVIQPLSAAQRLEIAEAIKTTEEKLTALNEQLTQQEALVAIKKELQQIAEEQARNARQKAGLIEQKAATRNDDIRLEQHEKLGPLQGDLKLYQKALKDQQNLQDELANAQAQQLTVEQDINSLLKEVSQQAGATVSASDVLSAINQFESEVLELDRLRKEKLAQGKEQRGLINRKKELYHLPMDERIFPKDGLKILSDDRASLLQKLKTAGLDKSVVASAARKTLRTRQAEYQLLRELARFLYEHRQLSEALATDEKTLEALETSISELAPLISKSEQLLDQFKANERLLLRQKEDALKIAELESLRPDLVDGEPCPLCGAVNHPYTGHAPEDQRSEIDKKIEQVRKDIIDETEALEKEKEKRAALQAKKHHLSQTLTKQQTQLISLVEKQEGLINAYTGSEALDLDKLRLRLPQIEQENQALEAGIEALEQQVLNAELTTAFEALQEAMSSYQEIDHRAKKKFDGENIRQHCEELRNRFQKSQNRSVQMAAEIESIKKQLKETDAQLASLKDKLRRAVEANGFSSIEDLSKHLLSEEEVARIRNSKEALQQQSAANEANEQRLKERLASQEPLDTAPDVSLNDLLTAKAQATEDRNALNVSLGSNRTRLEQDDNDRAIIANKAEALEKLEAEVKKWSLLNKMIGDAMGHKFSNFAQGLTLQNLLVYANRRLKKLSDRYLLIKPTDEGALKVLDLYQGNSERSVNTLSGGETFLLSLALALSLSDMASRNVSLDSLFIDEGFGTLDQETLDVAMTTLERLQSESQKTVGVISHVEALKERITVQVKLEKNSLGYSQIKVE